MVLLKIARERRQNILDRNWQAPLATKCHLTGLRGTLNSIKCPVQCFDSPNYFRRRRPW